MAGKGGGAWKVAYADFVTAMMAFFMVMWLLAQSDKVKQAVAKNFRNETGKYAPGSSLLPPHHEQYFKDQKPSVEQGESPPSVDAAAQSSRKPLTLAINNGIRTAIGTVIVFAPNSDKLDASATDSLRVLLPVILGKPQKIEIRGHAPRPPQQTPTGKVLPEAGIDPWKLSFQRCLATSLFLQEKGVPADRIRMSQAGATEPYSVQRGIESAPLENRVEIFLLSETAEDAFGTRDLIQQRFKNPESPSAGE